MKMPVIVSVTDLRRNFGRITADLTEKEPILLTKGGEPFAVLKAAKSLKRKRMKAARGVWEDTALDDDAIWERVGERKSRKEPIRI